MYKKIIASFIFSILFTSALVGEEYQPSTAQLQMLEQLPPDQRANI